MHCMSYLASQLLRWGWRVAHHLFRRPRLVARHVPDCAWRVACHHALLRSPSGPRSDVCYRTGPGSTVALSLTSAGAGAGHLLLQPLTVALTHACPAQKSNSCEERHLFLALHQLQLPSSGGTYAARHDPQSVWTVQSAELRTAKPTRIKTVVNFICVDCRMLLGVRRREKLKMRRCKTPQPQGSPKRDFDLFPVGVPVPTVLYRSRYIRVD